MKISITFRHLEPVDHLKSYVQEKMGKLENLAHKAVEAHVVLTEEKHNRTVEVTLNAKDIQARGAETTDDWMASIDAAIHKVEKTLVRHKERSASGKHKGGDSIRPLA